VLLAAIIAFLILAPFLPNTRLGHVVVQAMLTALILTTAMVERGRVQVIGVVSLIVVWVPLSWSVVLLHLPLWVDGIGHALVVVLLGLALRAVLSPVFAATTVEARTIAGAVSGYLLIAMTWAAIYQLIAVFDPDAFTSGLSSRSWISAAYLSLVTLTTVGYGDIVPVDPIARIWCGLEAVTGNLYMAVLIARLVSQWQTERRKR
jgi:voltage-gated potassium channel